VPSYAQPKFMKADKLDIHLAYLFASPLLLQTSPGSFFDCLPPISFKEEFEEILTGLEAEKIKFRYRYLMANEQNLKESLNDNPIGLHFAGHGFQNTADLFQQDKKGYSRAKGKGDVLIFEQKNGASSFFFEKDLERLLRETYQDQIGRLDFVVVASCHSECVGKIFKQAGIPHVICISK